MWPEPGQNILSSSTGIESSQLIGGKIGIGLGPAGPLLAMDAGLAEGSFNEGLSLTTVTKFGFVVYDLVLGSGWLLAMGSR